MSLAKQVSFGVIFGVLSIVLELVAVPIAPQTKVEFSITPLYVAAIAGTPLTALIVGFLNGIGAAITFGSWWATGTLALEGLIFYAITNLTRLPFRVRPIVGVVVGIILDPLIFAFPLQYVQGVPGFVVWNIIVPKAYITDAISGVIAAILVYTPQIRSLLDYFPR